jgi:hypothetical protein
MPRLDIQQKLWDGLASAAQQRRETPSALARRVLRDYLRCLADEELLDRSIAAARRTSFPISRSEEVVKRYRRKA